MPRPLELLPRRPQLSLGLELLNRLAMQVGEPARVADAAEARACHRIGRATQSGQSSASSLRAQPPSLCGVSRHTVRRWKDAGLLRTVELPFGMRRNLSRRSEVEALLDGRGR